MDSRIKKALKTIYDYLAISDPLKKADAIFLAGGSTISPVVKGAEIYKKGFADKKISLRGNRKTGNFSKRYFMVSYSRRGEINSSDLRSTRDNL